MEKNKTRLCEGTDLRAGCVVTTVNNQVHTIKRITYGNSVAEAENSYYRWEKDFPYEIEHAAMTPSDDDIRHVEFPPPHTKVGVDKSSKSVTLALWKT
jgi:hypothetical protein